MRKLIISAIGQDQPGIVAAFTKVLFESDCNIEDTSMTLLEDYFTMLFIVNASGNLTLEHLENQLTKVLQNFKLKLSIHEIDTNERPLADEGRPWMISVSGQDQTGIVFHVTQYLAAEAINIQHLSSKHLPRMQGEPLFLMALEVDVPNHLTDEALQEQLAQIADRENLEIYAEPMGVYTL
jgi:glycine cleavage system transcriptional repressor